VSILKKAQSLPENQRKIILWTIVILLGLTLLAFWSRSLEEKLGEVDIKGLEIPSLEIPNLEILNLDANQETSTTE